MSDYISKSALIEELEKVHPRVNGVDVFWSAMKVVENQPTLDEKEIIRKPFERVLQRLEEREKETYKDWEATSHFLEMGRYLECKHLIEIVKEEYGISE